MSNLRLHAFDEFRAAGFIDENGIYCDEMQEAVCENVLKLIDVFADEGHSGFSASYTVNLFAKLAKFEPIVPLTGEDWEWHEASPGVFQNKRCSHVFKQKDRFDGQAYDINAKVFWEWVRSGEFGAISKNSYTSGDSFVPITFPYTPKTEYVFVPTEEFPNEVLTDENDC
jgi:hypothetical protein